MVNCGQHIVGRGAWITISWLFLQLGFGLAAAATAPGQGPLSPGEILVCWDGTRAKLAGPAAADLARQFGVVAETPLWPPAEGRAKPAGLAVPLGAWSRLRLDPNADVAKAARAYAGLAEVRWAQPNYLRRFTAFSPDSLLGQQWSLAAMGWDGREAAAGVEVLVAIIDSGVDQHHPDLAGQLWENPAESRGTPGVDDDGNGYVDDVQGWDFSDAPGLPGEGDYLDRDADPDDESGHGTHVAGIVAALAGNAVGMAGVAPTARLMVLRAGFNMGGGGYLQDDDVAAAIVYAAENGARVLNLSFGDPNYSPLIQDVVRYAAQRGCTVVAAAGNEGNEAVFYPARLPESIAVGAMGREGQILPFSNYGYSLDLAAPGLGVLSLLPGGGYVERSGTSMAAAQVSGLAAAVLALHPEFNPAQVRGALLQSAQDLEATGWDPRSGAGAAQWRARQVQRPATLRFDTPSVGDSLRFEVFSALEAKADFSWSSATGPERWFDLGAELVLGASAPALAWPPAGLPSGPYLVRARLRSGGSSLEERVSVQVAPPEPVAVPLSLSQALDGPAWAQVAQWPAGGPGPDTLVISAPGETRPRYRIPDHPKGHQHWVRLPAELPPGDYLAQVGSAGAAVPFVVKGEPVQRWNLEQRLSLPEGYLLPHFPDFDGDGRRELVAMRRQGNRYNPVDFYPAGQTPPVFSTPLLFLPWAATDLDADGLAELVAVDAQRVRLVESKARGGFPLESVWQQVDAWGGEVADLDGDGRPELFPRSARAAFFQVLEAIGDNALRETAVLSNPTEGNNEAGERQVAADLDGDGRGELLSGDDDGDLWVHEAFGNDVYRLTWQQAGGPEGGDARLVGGAADLDGDGRTEFVVGRLHQDAYDPRQTRWSVEVYSAAGDNRFSREWQLEALGGKAGGNGINLGDWNGDGQVDVAVALPPHLYILSASGPDQYQTVWQARAGEVFQPAAGDLDGDGRLDLAFATGEGIGVFAAAPGLPGPAALRAYPLDSTRVNLDWDTVPGADLYRVYRNGALVATTTMERAYEDRDLRAGGVYQYQVSASVAGVESARSPVVGVRPEAPAHLIDLRRLGPSQLAASFDRVMAEPPPYAIHLEPGPGQPSSVLLDASGRRLVLGFAAPLPDSGHFTLQATGLRSAAGTPSATQQFPLDLSPYRPAGRLVSAELIDSAQVELVFSNEVGTAEAGDFVFADHGRRVTEVQVRGTKVRLRVDPPLRPLGRSYELRVAGVVAAAGDTMAGQALLATAAPDLRAVCFYPNPYHSGEGEGTFACLPVGAQVCIFDVEGRLRRQLRPADGSGGAIWDGRDDRGEVLPSGIYLFRVAAGGAVKQGKLAFIRD